MKLKELVVDNYYHATYKPFLSSILKDGLKKNISKKSWSGSGNFVYLSTDKNVAESYAETSDDVPEEYLDNIVILKIDANKIDRKLISKDEKNLAGDTLQYNGTIPANAIKVV